MKQLLLRYNLIWLLLLILFIPSFLGIISYTLGKQAIFKWMAHDYRLGGLQSDIVKTELNFHNFKTHAAQHYLEEWIAVHLPLRSFFIRLNNQIYYTIFKRSFTNNGNMVIGKHNQLFEMEYVKSYCGRKVRTEAQLIEWADKIKELSNFFEKRGKTFIYLITPSKADVQGKYIPKRYHCKTTGLSDHLVQFEPILKAKKIRYINGQLMLAGTKEYKTPMFPQGGIHWNALGASIAANAVIHSVNQQSTVALHPLQFDYTLAYKAKGQDRDLLWLLNLYDPNDNYVVPQVNYTNFTENKTATLTCIGGSFLEKMVEIFMQNQTFSKTTYFRYFKLNKIDYETNKNPITSTVDLDSKAFLHEALQSDVIILEENSALTISNHGELFYDTMKKFYL